MARRPLRASHRWTLNEGIVEATASPAWSGACGFEATRFVGAAIAGLLACRMATIVGYFFYGFFLGALDDPSTRN